MLVKVIIWQEISYLTNHVMCLPVVYRPLWYIQLWISKEILILWWSTYEMSIQDFCAVISQWNYDCCTHLYTHAHSLILPYLYRIWNCFVIHKKQRHKCGCKFSLVCVCNRYILFRYSFVVGWLHLEDASNRKIEECSVTVICVRSACDASVSILVSDEMAVLFGALTYRSPFTNKD